MQKLAKPTTESEVIQTVNLFTIDNYWVTTPQKFQILDERLIQNGQLELKKIFDSVLYHALD